MKEHYHVIGVMSGTSLDGIDLAELYFHLMENGTWSFEISAVDTVPYPANWKMILQDAFHFSEEKIEQLNIEYTQFLAEKINSFINQFNIKKLDAVCSHGHTIWHRPDEGITLQIGNLPELANEIRLNVVCDFRKQDVELGGQGAPLVPIGDRFLFSDYDYCLNLGGFANISFEKNKKRIAYDVCPVNTVLNYCAEKLGVSFDEGGRMAASGKLNTSLLIKLNELPYYAMYPPKSLGMEWVRSTILPLLDSSELSQKDILRTFVEHVARQMAAQFKDKSSVLITGGGVYNDFLINRVLSVLIEIPNKKDVKLVIPSEEIIEYKEALIFGFLGVLKLRNENNCLSSVTGSKMDHSSGKIFNPL